ncbi:MAG: hypothetical protein HQL52_18735 [Magnetococcales bacterium]|nr:hypothetical protein [Magnetococcales bacterium]
MTKLTGRLLTFWVALPLAILLPIGTHSMLTSHQQLAQAREKFTKAEAKHAKQQERAAQTRAWQRYAEEVNGFLKEADQAGIGESHWRPFDVDIKHRPLNQEELPDYFQRASHSDSHYFQPKRMTLTALTAEHLLPEKIRERLLMERLGQLDGPPLKPGHQVLLSLEGTYLVLPQP